jgi:trehalose 6-phosphate phosphatase
VPLHAPIADAVEPLRGDPARSAILLDVDGTLAPIVRHADDAHVPEPTRAPLIEIAKRYGLVACISGRRAATARRIVALGSITYVGNHGAELLRGGSTSVELDPEMAACAERVQRFAAKAFTGDLGRLRVRAEDKDAIAAFHWRGAPDEEAAAAAVRKVAAAAQRDGFSIHWGRKVLEVRPPVEMHKGKGVERLLRGAGIDTALYVGDDNTDLDAFRALRELAAAGEIQQAICVGVRDEETPSEVESEADVLVDGPLGVRALLEALAR